VLLLGPGDHVEAGSVIVAGTRVAGPPLHRTDLAGGPDTLVVVPDEEALGPGEDWQRLGGTLEFARIELPETAFPYRYRILASIVLAEAARQLGTRPTGGRGYRPRRQLTYESTLTSAAPIGAEPVTPGELYEY